MHIARGSIALAIIAPLACSDAAPDAAPTTTQPTAPPDVKASAVPELPEKEARPVEVAIAGDAVVRAGARLFFASTTDAGFELPTQTTARGMPVHVVGEENGRLVIETLSNQPPEHHCAATLDGLADFRLRFFLTKDDLLPVLTEPIEQTFADGTKIRVGAGVAVPSGATEILARGTAITITVPAERLARSYKPGTPFSDEGGDGSLAAIADQPLTYDGHTLAEDALFGGGSGATRFGVTERGDDALVTVRNRCLEATVKVSTRRLGKPVSGMYAMHGAFAVGDDEDVWGGLTGTEIGEAYDVGGFGLVGTSRGGSISHTVKAGAAIWWTDGRQAGQVVSEHRFTTAPRVEGGRKCFDASMVSGNATVVALCFAPVDVEDVAGSSFGTMGLSVGRMGGGGGSGSGFGSGSGSGSVPRVRQAAAEVEGELDKDIIRRIVRAHINEIRYCYNQGLTKDPALEGKITIEFTIAATGSVSASAVADSTVSDEAVGTCAAKAVKRWKFPKPDGGGEVVVKYPFMLEPG